MTPSEKKIQHRKEVRAAILEAAQKVGLKEGWQSLSIRKIAEAIDYSVPVIYDHFINKDAILLEFVKQGFELLNKDLENARISRTDPEMQIRSIGNAYLNFAFHHKEYYRLMFGLGIPSCEAVKEIPELGTFRQIVKEPINQLIKQNNKKQLEVMVKFKSFWSSLHGLISIDIMDITGKNSMNKKVLEDFYESFIAGIKH
jgi:AcrR family transcriptional regulator